MAAQKKARTRGGRRRIVKDPVRFTVDYERRDFEAAEDLADERGVSVATVIREALRAYLSKARRR